jgi:ribosomal protein L11 methyltransferase
MPTEQWMEGWKESFRPFSTDTFYVRPPWDEAAAPEGLISITIEPGMAFGTGQHATTRLCLEQLGALYKQQRTVVASKRVLDVGTGTGILAIGARLLGYGLCAGTDIDDDAIMAAGENCRMNKADVFLTKGSVPEVTVFDLVFANILAVVLLRIMDQLAAVVADGGHLILSGILVEEEQELAAKAAEFGLTAVTQGRQDGWSCLVLRK